MSFAASCSCGERALDHDLIWKRVLILSPFKSSQVDSACLARPVSHMNAIHERDKLWNRVAHRSKAAVRILRPRHIDHLHGVATRRYCLDKMILSRNGPVHSSHLPMEERHTFFYLSRGDSGYSGLLLRRTSRLRRRTAPRHKRRPHTPDRLAGHSAVLPDSQDHTARPRSLEPRTSCRRRCVGRTRDIHRTTQRPNHSVRPRRG
jgi:hypothetical protein